MAVLTPQGVTETDPRAGLDRELNCPACILVTVLTELYRLLVFESRKVGT